MIKEGWRVRPRLEAFAAPAEQLADLPGW